MPKSNDRNSSPTRPQPAAPGARPAAGVTSQGSVTSRQLFAGRRELLIEHEGQTYRLRITQQNKLILNK